MPSLPRARRALLWHVVAVMRANRSIPSSTVIPELAYADVGEASDWLCAAFGFTVRLRIASHRIQLNVGDGAVVATELAAPAVDRAHSVMIRVEDVDGHHARAVAPRPTMRSASGSTRPRTPAGTCGRSRSRSRT